MTHHRNTISQQSAEGRPSWHHVLSWVLVAFMALVIFFMSAHTASDLSDGEGPIATIKRALDALQAQWFGTNVDLVSSFAHFCEYTVFGVLLQNAFRLKTSPWKAVLFAILVGSLYGVTDEIHQIFVPGRACDPMDWIVDTLGTTLGALIGKAIHRS